MPEIRGLTVCVGRHYASLLRVTLPRNMRHLAECCVVTSPDDEETKAVARSVPGVTVFETDGFTRPDANGIRPRFNKGLCIEECFSFMGRHGWLCIFDADILWPDRMPLDRLRPDCIHGARRRILEDVSAWHEGLNWRREAKPSIDGGCPIGYTQIFSADAPAIRDRRPWYDVSFGHAGGGDAFFLSLWPRAKQVLLPMDVLHLGPKDVNWFGCDQEGRDLMARFVVENGWKAAARQHDPEAPMRAGELVERVSVPGYEPSTYELPFVDRARKARARRELMERRAEARRARMQGTGD